MYIYHPFDRPRSEFHFVIRVEAAGPLFDPPSRSGFRFTGHSRGFTVPLGWDDCPVRPRFIDLLFVMFPLLW